MKYEIGQKRIYNQAFADMGMPSVIHWEVLSIKNEQELCFEFIETNSKHRQGVRFAIDTGEGYIEVNGTRSKGIQLWEDTCPPKVMLRCVSSEGKLSIYNIFDLGSERGGVRSQVDSIGMLAEECDGYIIYRCNDVGFTGNFDKSVFRIRLL